MAKRPVELVRVKTPPGSTRAFVVTRRDWMLPGAEIYENPKSTPDDEANSAAVAGFDLDALDLTPRVRRSLEVAIGHSAAPAQAIVDLGQEGLEALSGIGAATAKRILEYAAGFVKPSEA